MNFIPPRGHKRRASLHNKQWQTILLYIVVVVVLFYLIFIVVRSFYSSVLLDKRDRINIVFYGEEAVLLSFGLVDDVHYIVSFSHADKVSVPGGYGRYVVGALGKLAVLEKDEELISRTFSSMSSAYVDYFVFPEESDVFEKPDTDSPAFIPSELTRRLFSRDYVTHGNIIDKIYLAYLISKHREQDFVVLRSIAQENDEGELEFSEKRFLKKYKGFFYHQSLREEGEEVRIVYDTYPGAVTLSRVIEGQGVRVVDLSKAEGDLQGRCIVTHSSDIQSKTVFYLSKRFNCSVKKGDTENADITLTMGTRLTEEWK